MSSHSSCLPHCRQPDILSLQSNLERYKWDSDEKKWRKRGKENKTEFNGENGTHKTKRKKSFFLHLREIHWDAKKKVSQTSSNRMYFLQCWICGCFEGLLSYCLPHGCEIVFLYYNRHITLSSLLIWHSMLQWSDVPQTIQLSFVLFSAWILSIKICVIMHNNRHSACLRDIGRKGFAEAVHRTPSLWEWVLPLLVVPAHYSNQLLSSNCQIYISFQLQLLPWQ